MLPALRITARDARATQRPVPQIGNGRGALAFEFNLSRLGGQLQHQVRPCERGPQIGGGGGFAPAAAGRGRVDADAFRLLAIEVRCIAVAERLAGPQVSLAERMRHRVHIRYPQRTGATVRAVLQ
jgi:hypothetical protein